MKIISDSQYFTASIFYKKLCCATHVVFEQYELSPRRSFRNRTMIAGANGLIGLSVPLEQGRNYKGNMKDLRISPHTGWQSQHWKTLVSCYNRSPWFEFYREELARVYERPFTFLLDWNLNCFEWSIQKLGLSLEISLTKSGDSTYPVGEFIDWRNRISPKNYLDFVPLRYTQVFEERMGFLPNLSILDLLFCEGKNAQYVIQSENFPQSP